MRSLVVGLLLIFACTAQAGTTVIHVDTEDGGNVEDAAHVVVNAKGALFWNGSIWVTNDTAAHMYFTDLRTGERLQNYTTTVIQGTTPGIVSTVLPEISIVRSQYSYSKNVPGGVYNISAMQYRLTRSGRTIALQSRAAGPGTANSFFDVYVENENGVGVTAMRGDPIWFNYSMSLTQALAETSPSASLRGYLPSVGANYFMDINGGSDMGGITYQLRTGTLPGVIPALGLGSSYVTSFSYKAMDGSNELQELRFVPYADGTFTPTVTPTDPPPQPGAVPLPPSAFLVLTGLGGAALYEIRRRRKAGIPEDAGK